MLGLKEHRKDKGLVLDGVATIHRQQIRDVAGLTTRYGRGDTFRGRKFQMPSYQRIGGKVRCFEGRYGIRDNTRIQDTLLVPLPHLLLVGRLGLLGHPGLVDCLKPVDCL